ncbi:MAG: hypothetical protein M3137_14455 [Actinomycetota bacterium]|nr:hypothetical protein [Actinomycetota bacterium]
MVGTGGRRRITLALKGGGMSCSLPEAWIGAEVWCRVQGEELVRVSWGRDALPVPAAASSSGGLVQSPGLPNPSAEVSV